MTTWRELIAGHMGKWGESLSQPFTATFDEGASFDREFDDGYGAPEGGHFTLWTDKRVYFPVVYDGAEWVESVSRHPDGQPTEHVGGW